MPPPLPFFFQRRRTRGFLVVRAHDWGGEEEVAEAMDLMGGGDRGEGAAAGLIYRAPALG